MEDSNAAAEDAVAANNSKRQDQLTLGTNGALYFPSNSFTLTPTAAAIGPGGGALQCSNGVWYAFSSTDGAALITKKLSD